MKVLMSFVLLFAFAAHAENLADAKKKVEDTIAENTGWLKDKCQIASVTTDLDWKAIEKLNLDSIYKDYPKQDRLAIAVSNQRFIGQIESTFSDLFQGCEKDEALKKMFSKTKKIKFNVQNLPSKKGGLYKFNSKTGELLANISIYDSYSAGLTSDEMKAAFGGK